MSFVLISCHTGESRYPTHLSAKYIWKFVLDTGLRRYDEGEGDMTAGERGLKWA